MTSWLHRQRLEAVQEAVSAIGASTVLDLGCGGGDLLVHLAQAPQVAHVVGVDVCEAALDRLRGRLDALGDRRTARVDLLQRSLVDADSALEDFDCAVLVETVEHIEPSRLSGLERAIFGAMRPRAVILTTPNAEFNPLLGVPAGRFRHPDHRFEWTRERFRRWAAGVAARRGYEVACRDIAGNHPDLGGASQMAVFRDRRAEPSRRTDAGADRRALPEIPRDPD